MNGTLLTKALLDAAKAAEVVRSVYTYQPKDLASLPALAAGDRAGAVTSADEAGVALAGQQTVTFYLLTDAEKQPALAFANSDAALDALLSVMAEQGWSLTRYRQLEAQWGVRNVIVYQLFLSSSLAFAPTSSGVTSTFIPEPGL